jgi:hypothetical protein
LANDAKILCSSTLDRKKPRRREAPDTAAATAPPPAIRDRRSGRESSVDGAFNMTKTPYEAGADGRPGGLAGVDDPGRVRRPGVQAVSMVDVSGRVWLDCPGCGLDGGPYGLDEAGQLGGTHDDLIHDGRPTVLVVAGVTV